MLNWEYYSVRYAMKAWHLSSPCSVERSAEAEDYGSLLERRSSRVAQLHREPARHEKQTSLRVDVEPLCVHAQKHLTDRARRKVRKHARFTWADLGEHESRALTRLGSWILSGWIVSVGEAQWSGENTSYHTSQTDHYLSLHAYYFLLKSLISDFLLTLLSLGAVFHFSKTATGFLSLHLKNIYLLRSLSLSAARCCLSVCGWGERPLEQNESRLLALCPHWRWLHTLRCEITS